MIPLAAAVLALAAFAVALAAAGGLARPLWLHGVFAVGMLPLIFAAQRHFVPVLTRTHAAERWTGATPLLALAGAVLALGGFHGLPGLAAAPWPALVAAIGMLAWMRRRRHACLGAPHPGLGWYEAALGCLIAALAAAAAMPWLPGHWPALKRLHLHLNLLGLLGLTALGTLQVLVPTVTGRADPGAAPRLRRDLPLALGGTLLVATGAAALPPLAALGGVLWLWVWGRWAWSLRQYGRALLAPEGLPLATAAAGFGAVLVHGGLHGAGLIAAAPAPILLIPAFLLPLVSGALVQLAPLWRFPGIAAAPHRALRVRLARGAGPRCLLFAASALLVLTGVRWAPLPAAAGIAWFALQAAVALRRPLPA